MSSFDQVPILLKHLYEIVSELQKLFPGRHFTPDGHLVGSIGEVWAAHYYNLQLAQASTEGYDAKTGGGIKVEIKATQGKQVSLRSNPNHLLVLKINPNGDFEEIYNGPGYLVWKNIGKLQKNGQRSIQIAKLRELMKQVPDEEKLPKAAQTLGTNLKSSS